MSYKEDLELAGELARADYEHPHFESEEIIDLHTVDDLEIVFGSIETLIAEYRNSITNTTSPSVLTS